jgi:hypothetical protein
MTEKIFSFTKIIVSATEKNFSTTKTLVSATETIVFVTQKILSDVETIVSVRKKMFSVPSTIDSQAGSHLLGIGNSSIPRPLASEQISIIGKLVSFWSQPAHIRIQS